MTVWKMLDDGDGPVWKMKREKEEIFNGIRNQNGAIRILLKIIYKCEMFKRIDWICEFRNGNNGTGRQ